MLKEKLDRQKQATAMVVREADLAKLKQITIDLDQVGSEPNVPAPTVDQIAFTKPKKRHTSQTPFSKLRPHVLVARNNRLDSFIAKKKAQRNFADDDGERKTCSKEIEEARVEQRAIEKQLNKTLEITELGPAPAAAQEEETQEKQPLIEQEIPVQAAVQEEKPDEQPLIEQEEQPLI